MQFKDYYAIMGVPRDATADQIKQAYRKLARKYHPDVSKEKDAEERFKEVGEAYEALHDPQKRAAYDQLGSGPKAGEDFQPPPGFGAGFGFREPEDAAGGGDTSDFFESLFGRPGFAGSRRRRDRGEDHHARVLIDLEASLHGGTRTVVLRIPEAGDDGRSQMTDRTLNVKIPAGIQAGQSIRLAGQGQKGPPGTKPGDLFLEVSFAAHALYRPEGRDLNLELPVAPWELALGASVPVPTPGGAVDLKVPAGSKPGARLRLRGRGLPANPPGDLYVTLQIALPPADTDAAKAAYAAFAAAAPFNPRSQLGV
jgi:curved DNA-binding protein